MLLKVLATGHNTDIYFIQCTSPFNYIPVGGGIPPWEVEVFDGLWKLVSLYTNHAFPPQSSIFRKPKITDTFRHPILVTDKMTHHFMKITRLKFLDNIVTGSYFSIFKSFNPSWSAHQPQKVATIVITKSVMESFQLSWCRFF